MLTISFPAKLKHGFYIELSSVIPFDFFTLQKNNTIFGALNIIFKAQNIF